MISEAVLERAVADGVISAVQAEGLRGLARDAAPSSPPSLPAVPPRLPPDALPEPIDEEKLRFVTGFADIFVTIGLGLFLGAATFLIGQSLGPYQRNGAVTTFAILAAMAWVLAEFFTRRRRMALPSIVLLVVFAFASFVTLAVLLISSEGFSGSWWSIGALGPEGEPRAIALAATGTAALAGLHYWRFQVPITVAAGIAALGMTVLAVLFGVAPDATLRAINPILLALGLATFGLAMRFDLSDPARTSRRTDIAFWLHLLASPLIVHSLFQLIGAGEGLVAPRTAFGIIAVFLGLAAVAVLVDRRAMLVSGLVYAGIALGSLVSVAGMTRNVGLPLTLLVLGGFVLLLSAGWSPLRRAILSRLPSRFAARLPRPAPV